MLNRSLLDEMLGPTLESVYAGGIKQILYLQKNLYDWEPFLTVVTSISDPAHVFAIVVPVLAVIHTQLAARVLCVSLVAEWTNTMLKWIFREDRPFWWVQETNFYTSLTRPQLRHTALTCETGPGSPSGHLQGTAAWLFVLAKELADRRWPEGTSGRQFRRTVLGLFFVAILVLVSASRMMVAAHFPHQCVFGAILGVMLSNWLLDKPSPAHSWWERQSRPQMMGLAVIMILVAAGCYGCQRLLGIDPQWSVRLAFKWCTNPKHVHVSSTPMFCLIRDTAVALGLALSAPLAKRYNRQHNLWLEVPLSIALALGVQNFSSRLPTHDVWLFFLLQYTVQVFSSWLYLVGIPYIGVVCRRRFKRRE